MQFFSQQMAGSPINEGDIEIQLVESDGDDTNTIGVNGTEANDRLEHFYTALNWVKQELVSLSVMIVVVWYDVKVNELQQPTLLVYMYYCQQY